ncbi:MAG: hypothetical protein Q9163_005293 [Psora crenata]
MTSNRSIPVAPEKQRSLSHLSARSWLTDNLDCSPETSKKLQSLKRKASSIGDLSSPRSAQPFLAWRLECIDRDLELLDTSMEAYKEANVYYETSDKTQEQHLVEVREERDDLIKEKRVLIGQLRFFAEDLSDTSGTIEEAYIKELQISFHEASRKPKKSLKQPQLRSGQFKAQVTDYLDARQDKPGLTRLYCNVLATWAPSGVIKCAHIVPSSFDVKELSYMFGTEEVALESPRNGLMLHKMIEEAFENGDVAIFPYQSVQTNPTEWKIIVLKPDIMNWEVYWDSATDKTTRWKDIDGRKLSFLNDNRPARRYLYMRYALAWLHAERQGFKDFKDKVPPGTIWASPDKPSGYLRKSILRSLAREVGDRDELPTDLIQAGEFEDPATATNVGDAVGGLTMPLLFRKHLEGERDKKEEDSNSDEEEEEEEEQEEQQQQDGEDRR